MKLNAKIILLFFYLVKLIYSNINPVKDFTSNKHRKCNHQKKQYQKNFLAGKYDRKLASAYYNDLQFQNMRIHFDYTYTLPHEEKMLRELVMPPVKTFFENTLSIRRFPGKLRFPKAVKDCQGIPVPLHLMADGVDTDLIIVVSTYRGMKKFDYENTKAKNKTKEKFNGNGVNNENNAPMSDYLNKFFTTKQLNQNMTTINTNTTNTTSKIPYWEINDGPSDVVGWSFMCLQDIYTLRPLAGVLQYVADIEPTPRAIEEAIWTTLHEISHVLAMDYDLYSDFIDSEFNRISIDKTLKLKTRLKDLDKMLEERKDVMNDFDAFANFNSSFDYNSNGTNLNLTKNNNNSTSCNESVESSLSPAINNSIAKNNNTDSNFTNKKLNSNKLKNKILSKFKITAHQENTHKTLNQSNITLSNITSSLYSNSSDMNTTLKNIFEVFMKTRTLPTITLPVTDQYYDIKVPSNINFTTLVLYISNFLDHTKLFISTPKVVEVGKKHFGCSSTNGVELEHFGGLGSAFSHWSKRILNTEFMIADSYGENYISNFTLALFEDSGWYKVDYSKAEVVPWGKDKGCSFLEEKCIMKRRKKNSFFTLSLANEETGNNESSNITLIGSAYDTNFKEEFCTSFEMEKCSISHTFRAVCGVSKFNSVLPQEFQYFDNPKIGGFSNFGDFCPYPIEWVSPQNSNPIGSCKNGVQLRSEIGEKICENCRCFHSSLVEEKFNEKNSEILRTNATKTKYHYLNETRAACYETKCRSQKNGKVELYILIDDVEIKCPRGGAVLSVDGYKGFVECPKPENICVGVLDPKADYTTSSAYNLFAHLSEKLLNILYDFISNKFNKNNK